MTLATTLRNAARSLINTFGNTVSVYSYSSATKTENTEGDMTVSDWGTPASVKAVDGENASNILTQVTQGREQIGDDEKIFLDSTALAVDDRITSDSTDFRVEDIRKIISQDTLVINIVRVARVKDTTNW